MCSRALLDWPYVQKRFPWGVAILFGGGFALAGDNWWVTKISTVLFLYRSVQEVRFVSMGRPGAWGTWGPPRLGHGGHRLHIGEYLLSLKVEKMIAAQVAGLTEITSNVATANILLPVLAEVSSYGSVFNLFWNFAFLYLDKSESTFLFSISWTVKYSFFQGSPSNVNKPTLPDDPCNCECYSTTLSEQNSKYWTQLTSVIKIESLLSPGKVHKKNSKK